MPEVSIVIVCMNRLDNLRPCLESIHATTGVSYETLVVAYLFSPENLSKARTEFPWVTFIESDEVRGFAENNNLALSRARGRFCFILNDDTELRMDSIGRLVADFDILPEDTAIVAATLLNADGSLQLCGRPAYPAVNYLRQQWHLYKEPVDIRKYSEPAEGGLYVSKNISGAAFLIRTEVFRSLGWFDERYFFTPEDIALSTKAWEEGFRVYVDPAAEVVHKWRTTASRLSPAVRPAAVRGSLIFFSGGSAFRYLLLGAGVWCAEFAKRVKARFQGRGREYLTYRNISRSIFTRSTPKELFIKYRNEI